MNLRLSRNSIRIRIEYEEALKLLNSSSLEEDLPLWDKSFKLQIEFSNEGNLCIDKFFDFRCMKLLVPKANLEQMLVNLENRASKTELELKEKFTLGGDEIELRFEIDRKLKSSPKVHSMYSNLP